MNGIRVEILEDHTTQIMDQENNILATIDPEEMSPRLVQFISMGLYIEVLELVLQMREIKVTEVHIALEKFGYTPNKP